MAQKHMPVLWKLLHVFIFIAKVKKLLFEKYYSSLVRKSQRNRKKLRFMEYYYYSFYDKCESHLLILPSFATPKKQSAKNKSSMDLETLFFLCKCWGSLKVLEGEDYIDFTVEALPPSIDFTGDANTLVLLEPSLDWEEEALIDLQAKRFIERFYEDMRMQRKKSI